MQFLSPAMGQRQVGEELNSLQIWLRFSKGGKKKSSKISQVFRWPNPTDFPGTNPCTVSLPAQVAAVLWEHLRAILAP